MAGYFHSAIVFLFCGALGFAIPPPAPTVTIAPGVELPLVVLGTGSGQKGNVTLATQLWLQSTNGVGIDTAYDYMDEGSIAKGIAASGKERSQFFIETKIPCSTYEQAKANFASNLEQLNLKFVDLTLIHFNKCDGAGSIAETWKALEEGLQAGQTKAIGVSHFTREDLEQLGSKPSVNQCELSVSYHDDATIQYCQQQGIVYQSFSPLCGGFNGSSCSAHGGKNVLTIPEVKKIAAVHNVSAAQVALKWIVQQGFPLATATWRLDFMNEDLDLWSWGNLSSSEMSTLSHIQPSL
mmetsp:Transcript_15439/g.30358  ORF Transcript_15439/g.30358 Transcript_15439/m.30358 type:complete len:295 (+) Transcript_15439:33-917(+)|eukprot:CAMPEP_0175140186 /NCGR_PEP_ID=MMETSP0087-20121206/11322_1 /TAXON_ID=136419 /ORGANISM="Unknown Unknown, Strain D1" /LENGTH=294 /DNA_ID=CAMNT_0016423287 /DNA_START=30 /DNA_END=914 /DNA_ORIENTATION=-